MGKMFHDEGLKDLQDLFGPEPTPPAIKKTRARRAGKDKRDDRELRDGEASRRRDLVARLQWSCQPSHPQKVRALWRELPTACCTQIAIVVNLVCQM